MRTTTSLRLTLACFLTAVVAAAGEATAAPVKRIAAHRASHAQRPAHVLGERAAEIARRMVGVPYRWGGSSPSGFDCSGLVTFAYGRLGVRLPHSSYALFRLGRRVGFWGLRPGDLVFFYGAGHVGVYLGHRRFIAATHSGDRVRIGSLRDSRYAASYVGARRLAVAVRPS